MTACLFWCGRFPLKPCRMLQPNPQDNPKFRKRLDALRTPDDQSNSNWSLSAVLFLKQTNKIHHMPMVYHGLSLIYYKPWQSCCFCCLLGLQFSLQPDFKLVGGQFCASSRSWDILGRYNMMSKNVKAQIKQRPNRSSNLSVYLSIYLSVYLSFYLSIYLSILSYLILSIYLSVHPSI
jgi:hypothetical protein